MIGVLELRPTPRHFLAGTAVLLGLLALWPWIAPIPAQAPASDRDNAAALQTSVPALPPAATLAAIGERPLFSPSRRPAPTSTAIVETGAATRYRLLGLISVGTSRRALIGEGPRRIEISEGATLDHWTVTRIEQDRVLLSSLQGDAVLTLQHGGADVSSPATR